MEIVLSLYVLISSFMYLDVVDLCLHVHVYMYVYVSFLLCVFICSRVYLFLHVPNYVIM